MSEDVCAAVIERVSGAATGMSNEDVVASVIAKVLLNEGGIADVGDGQGVTRFGQTPGWLLRWRLPAPTTRDEAAANYRAWLAGTKLEAVCDVDDGFANAVIDWAVHAGHERAIRALQTAIGTRPTGVIDADTERLIHLAALRRSDLAKRIVADRLRHLGRLLKEPKNTVYASGWLNRMAGQVEGL